jgi:hypothetical protein
MLSPADRIIEATMPHTLRPKRGNREKVIAAALEFVIEEYGYYVWDFGYDSKDIIDVKDLQELIDELKSTVTPEELAQEHPQDPPDAL